MSHVAMQLTTGLFSFYHSEVEGNKYKLCGEEHEFDEN